MIIVLHISDISKSRLIMHRVHAKPDPSDRIGPSKIALVEENYISAVELVSLDATEVLAGLEKE